MFFFYRNGSPNRRERSESISSGGWIVLGNSPIKHMEPAAATTTEDGLVNYNKTALVHARPLVMHDSLSFLKCCESLAFLIRDVAHITPHNFHNCVMAIRTFVEASFQGRAAVSSTENLQAAGGVAKKSGQAVRSHAKRTPMGRAPPMRRVRSAPQNMDYDADESDGEDFSGDYLHVALQLLDLMQTLHTRAGQIHKSWAEESGQQEQANSTGNLWPVAWCPLLQGMARLCCDKRSHIRTQALTELQRALLFQDLQSLSPREWEAAFTVVLFPMLDQLLLKSNPGEKTAMEETRTRAATLLGKVFLQHLAPLSTLPWFAPLWLTILDFMQRFIGAASSDLLADAVPESLKNMLLVMDTAGIFFSPDGSTTELWSMTKEKLDTFLPQLMEELFGKREHNVVAQVPQAEGTVLVTESAGQGDAAAVAVVAAPAAPTELPPAQEVVGEAVAASGPPPPSPLDPPKMSSSAFAEMTAQAVPSTIETKKEETAQHLSSEKNQEQQPQQEDVNKQVDVNLENASVEPPLPPPQAVVQPPPFSIGPPSLLPTSALRSSTAVVAAPGSSNSGPIKIPSLPEIAPMPPPPIPMPPAGQPPPPAASSSGFQPIHAPPPPPTGGPAVSMAAPVAIPAPNPQIAAYFGAQAAPQQPGATPNMAGNILTAAFSPTVPDPTSAAVYMGPPPPTNQQQQTSEPSKDSN